MSDILSAPRRRGFLGALAAGAAALGIGNQASNAVAAEAGKGTDFQKWLDTIPGKYKQLYDMPSANNGYGLVWSYVFLLTGAQGYDVPESDLGAVVVLRHAAIPVAMKDEVWAKYKLGEFFKINDPATKAPAERNPFAFVKPGDLPVADAALEKLIARNVRVAVCGAAIQNQSGRLAKAAGLEHEAVKKDWLGALIPGVTVVPSGVLAINGAQSKGASYCFAG